MCKTWSISGAHSGRSAVLSADGTIKGATGPILGWFVVVIYVLFPLFIDFHAKHPIKVVWAFNCVNQALDKVTQSIFLTTISVLSHYTTRSVPSHISSMTSVAHI